MSLPKSGEKLRKASVLCTFQLPPTAVTHLDVEESDAAAITGCVQPSSPHGATAGGLLGGLLGDR